MTREEAINEIKSWDFLEGKEIEAIHTLIPELAESEDERIRAVILKLVLGMRDEIFTTADKSVTKPKVLAWLKKQKDKMTAEEYVGRLWKPSEEQMEALEYVIRDYREDSCNATANYLQEILDHLKNM